MISKSAKIIALCALPLLLVSCTNGDTKNQPDTQTFSEKTVNLESLPVFKKTHEIPDNWKALNENDNSPSLSSANGKCSITVETRNIPYTGMGMGDDSLARSTFLANYGSEIKTSSAIRSTINIPKFIGEEITFETYDFEGKRGFSEGEGAVIKSKDSHSFVAIRGFDQPLDIDSGEKVTPVIVIDYNCTDKESFDLTTAKQMIESMEFGYVNTENETNEEPTTGEENE